MTGLLDSLIQNLIERHPLPWSIDYDWLVEVWDSNQRLVIKLMLDRDARDLVSHAERLAQESLEAHAEAERMLNEPAI